MQEFTRSRRIAVSMVLALVAGPNPAHAQAVLSEFAGSTPLGTYESDFDRLAYLTSLDREAPFEGVEGRLLSRVFEKPAGRSNLEVFRSYQNELEAGGFTIHLAAQLDAPKSFRVKQAYDPPHTPSMKERHYEKPDGGRLGQLDIAFVSGAADHYMIASRVSGGEERWVAVLLSGSRPTYMVEELTREAMETGTVTLNLEALRSAIEDAGKIAIYDIHFATASAVIEPESAVALGVIATYLAETPGAFYIVGHTDDTGSLEGNMTLSAERAAAVKRALVEEHGVDPSRLETRGVGPLAPVSTNAGDAGRALNRRVEVVQRLP